MSLGSDRDVELEMLWRLNESYRAEARHHGEQRERVIAVVTTLSGAFLAFVAAVELEPVGRWMIGGFVGVFGLASCLVCWKLFERQRRSYDRATAFREALSDELKSLDIVAKIDSVDKKIRNDRRFRYFQWLHIHQVWISLGVGILILGLLIAFLPFGLST